MNCVDLKNGKASFRDCGSGPAVLFGHSYLWSSSMWDRVIEVMSSKFRCIAPDLPGHGSTLETPFDLEKLAEFHAEIMEGLGIEEYSLAGLSIGAMWGSHLLNLFPDRVTKFAVINSSLLPEPPENAALYDGMLAAVDAAGKMPPLILDQIVPGFFSDAASDTLKAEFRRSLEELQPEQIPQITACGTAFVHRGDLVSQLQKSKSEMLFIAGSKDHYRSVQEAEQGAKRLGANVKLLECGHISAEELPVELSRVLSDFFMG